MIDNEKRKNIYIMILSALIVVVSIVAILFFVEIRSVKETLVAKEQEYKSSLDSVNNESATKVENTVIEKEVEKKVEVPVNQLIKFDLNKAKKVREGVTYGNIMGNANLQNLDIEILDNGNLGITKYTNNTLGEEKEVTGFKSKVYDVVSTWVGDGSSEYIVCLMQDGTVEYMTDILNRDYKVSEGKIEGLNNIVRILCCKTSSTTVGNTGRTIIAIDKDGYFYDVVAVVKGQVK